MLDIGEKNSDQDAADVMILNGLASVYSVFGQYGQAESLLDLSLWIDPDDEATLVLMAALLTIQNRPAEARSFVAELDERDVTVPDEVRHGLVK